jgi:hypothetical protein
LDTIKLKASAACEASGAGLVELAATGDASCPNGALWAKFACSCTAPGKYDPNNASGITPPPAGVVAAASGRGEGWLN